MLFKVLWSADPEQSLRLRDGVQIKLNLGNSFSSPLQKSNTELKFSHVFSHLCLICILLPRQKKRHICALAELGKQLAIFSLKSQILQPWSE